MSTAERLEASVLIVEDDEPTAELERRALTRSGRRSRVVSGVREALEAMRKESFLVVLLDYRLPDGEPWPVLEAARNSIPRIPVILVTAMGDERIAAEVIHRGGADYLIKTGGFSEQLPAAIERLIRQGEVEQANQRLAAIVESSDDAILSQTPDGLIASWNAGAEQLFGYPASEAIGRPVAILVPPDRTEEAKSIHEAVERLETSRRLETVRRRKDGTPVDVSITVSPILDGARQVVGAATIARDITERLRSEQVSRENADRFRQLAESVREVFWLTDLERGRIIYISPAYESIWGRTSQDLYDSPGEWQDAIHPEDRERVAEAVKTKQTLGLYAEEYRITRPDGTVRWIQDKAFPVRDEAGRVVRIAGVAEDVTEQRRLEQQLRQSQKMEAVGQLAGGVAHDFNNLLTVIGGHSELVLATPDLERTIRESVEEIRGAGERATALTRQLLAFSRKQILQPKVLDLNGIVLEMNKMLGRLIGEHVRLRTSLADDLGRVRVDPGQIEQVIMNLAVNARDAMPEGGALTIETANVDLDDSYASSHAPTRPGRYVMLAVSDTGTGMDAETRSRLFEPFFTTKEPGKGTGLGLATTYGIVKQSDGFIWVYSELDRGTTFKIYLPMVDAPVDPISSGGHKAAASRGTETILLVEDEEPVRRLARSVLEAAGYTVLGAASGPEALEILSKYAGSVELLLTDAVMPGMSGRALAERVRKSRPETKVLVMSGYTADAANLNGVASGTRFMEKPFTPRTLTRKVRDVLDR